MAFASVLQFTQNCKREYSITEIKLNVKNKKNAFKLRI